jgi:DNA ligase 1
MIPSRRNLLLTLCASALNPTSFAKTADLHAPRIALPSLWSDALDPALYWTSEKYDGVRGVWNGTELRFRSGRPVSAPAWFTAQLPREPLDGELWLGRGRFDELSGVVRKNTPIDSEWRQVRYMVFEQPPQAETVTTESTYTQRLQRLQSIVKNTAWPSLMAVQQTRVANSQQLHEMLATTVAQGGEGLVLHLAAAPYQAGRTQAVLKLKPSLDTEATVVGYQAGQGKYQGLVGALKVRSPQGREFLIGTGLSDALRRQPPPIGSVVTYRYRDVTSTGLPRFASFMRMHTGI